MLTRVLPIEPFLGNIFSTTVIMYWAGFLYHFFLASEISMLGTSMPLVMEFASPRLTR